jgi:uncharacterized Zn-binding protein involved in type VI secretion
MPPAARVWEPTNHPGMIGGPGVPSVLIGGRPAAVVGMTHICALPPNAGPHPPTPLVTGSVTVLIGGRAAVRLGDMAACGAMITRGARNVLIGG